MLLPEEDPVLSLPRIICLHGGGANARIFELQCRRFIPHLKNKFRLVFVDGPYLSEPGPGMIPVYEKFGPFRRWLRWRPDQPQTEAETIIKDIDDSIQRAMDIDDHKGATGEWVALLGFSQGAKVCASLLLRQQIRQEKLGKEQAGSMYRFAILMAGRAPLVSLDPDNVISPVLAAANEVTAGIPSSIGWSSLNGSMDHILRLPAIHVHGLRDPGLHLHRQMLDQYCQKDEGRLVQWDGDHRVAIKDKDVTAIVDQILSISRQTGVFV